MFTAVSIEDLIPQGHPIRRIRRIVDEVLAALDPEFAAMYSHTGRPGVPPERLLKATVLTALYSIRAPPLQDHKGPFIGHDFGPPDVAA